MIMLQRDNMRQEAFTLIEIIIVIAILIIASMVVGPMLSVGAETQIRSAANIIAADIDYARNMAFTTQQQYAVAFNIADNSYEVGIWDDDTQTLVSIAHPVTRRESYAICFSDNSRLDRVSITSAVFDSAATIIFDYLGRPYNVSAQPLAAGGVRLDAGGLEPILIDVVPVTGHIEISGQ